MRKVGKILPWSLGDLFLCCPIEWQRQFSENQKIFETYQPVAGNGFGSKSLLSQEAIAYLST